MVERRSWIFTTIGVTALSTADGRKNAVPASATMVAGLASGVPGPSSRTSADPEHEATSSVQADLDDVPWADCLDLATAITTTREILDRHRLDDWTVTKGKPFTSAEPCATTAIDPATKIILIVPIPPD